MSTSSKVALGIVVIALIAGGILYMKGGNKKAPIVENTVATTTSPKVETPPKDDIASRDNSNASLDQDMTTLDAQLKVVDAGGTEVDKSLNDKPVSQTQ